MMKIYVASSWRNELQSDVVQTLRRLGYEVYDFKHPKEGNDGFGWKQVNSKPVHEWTIDEYLTALNHPIAEDGFNLDMKALEECDVCVLVLPCGRSAHLELGYAVGAKKKTIVYIPQFDIPELMYKMCDKIAVYIADVVTYLKEFDDEERAQNIW